MKFDIQGYTKELKCLKHTNSIWKETSKGLNDSLFKGRDSLVQMLNSEPSEYFATAGDELNNLLADLLEYLLNHRGFHPPSLKTKKSISKRVPRPFLLDPTVTLFTKNKRLKKLVSNLLSIGLIWPISSPFSSQSCWLGRWMVVESFMLAIRL